MCDKSGRYLFLLGKCPWLWRSSSQIQATICIYSVLFRGRDLALEGLLQFGERQNVCDIFCGINDALGNEIDGLLEFVSGAGHGACQTDFVENKAVELEGNGRRHGIANGHDFTTGLYAIEAGCERGFSANGFEDHVEAPVGGLLHPLGSIRGIAVEIEIEIANLAGLAGLPFVNFGHGEQGCACLFGKAADELGYDAAANHKDLVVQLQAGLLHRMVGDHQGIDEA